MQQREPRGSDDGSFAVFVFVIVIVIVIVAVLGVGIPEFLTWQKHVDMN